MDPEMGHGKPRKHHPLVRHLLVDVDVRYAYIPLLVCCFLTGLLDSTTFNGYSTFVSMQTGNTIFIGLGTASETSAFSSERNAWLKPFLSLVCFIIGCFFFSRLHSFLSPRRRGTVCLSFILQAILVLISAASVQAGVLSTSASTRDINYYHLLPIAFLSFQAAGQIALSRSLSVSEVPTVVVTSLLCDLFSDPGLFALPLGANVKRTRRALGFTLTLLGAITGAWIARKTDDQVSVSLWVVGGVKLVLGLAWVVWKG